MNKISGFTEDFRLHSAQWTFISCMIMIFCCFLILLNLGTAMASATKKLLSHLRFFSNNANLEKSTLIAR